MIATMSAGFKEVNRNLEAVGDTVKQMKSMVEQLLNQREEEKKKEDVLAKYLFEFWKAFVSRLKDNCPSTKFVAAIIDWFKDKRWAGWGRGAP